MEKYTIYCTKDQTKKALELGAPIEKDWIPECLFNNGYFSLKTPTTEQMISWFEETYDLHISIDYRRNYADDADGNIVDEWYYYCFFLSIADKCFYGEDTLDEYPTRKEVTLAAIDAALKYLCENNLIK